jgi:hypothetical protein
MPPKVDPKKRKEAKQRKMLLLLAPVLVILLVIQGPKLLKVVSGSKPASEPAAAETAAATDAAATAPVPAGAPSSAPAVLVESDVPPPAGEGQLVSFGRFTGKDPFRQLVELQEEVPNEAPSGGDSGSTEPADGGTDTEPAHDHDHDHDDAATANTAELTVNGAAETVAVGGSFPAADPVFRLASINGKTAQIGLVTGSFSTGVATLDLKVGETLTLVSQPDGVRYKIKLLNLTVGTAE